MVSLKVYGAALVDDVSQPRNDPTSSTRQRQLLEISRSPPSSCALDLVRARCSKSSWMTGGIVVDSDACAVKAKESLDSQTGRSNTNTSEPRVGKLRSSVDQAAQPPCLTQEHSGQGLRVCLFSGMTT